MLQVTAALSNIRWLVAIDESVLQVTDAAIEFIIGSWMVGNAGLSSVFMGPNECSTPCVHAGWEWKGNQLNYSQFRADVGCPLGSAQQGAEPASMGPSLDGHDHSSSCGGVWWRKYSKSIVFVNPRPAPGPPCEAKLEVREGGWRHLNGTSMPITALSVSVAAASANEARVTLSTSSASPI